MIKTIIFDFGDVFINLDKKGAMKNALELFQIKNFDEDLISVNALYEQGLMTTDEFLEFYLHRFPNLSKIEILHAWNYILKDFPLSRLKFIQKLKKDRKYHLILLSNTNELHIDWIKNNIEFYEDFKNCFDIFYLSHEINLRKPNSDIYQYVLDENRLLPSATLFIDDTEENILTASALGIQTWHLNPEKENVLDLFSIKKDLF